jgi:DMSO/TMAO reductase YedYZ molybdopterin-dependent catalytic subunit
MKRVSIIKAGFLGGLVGGAAIAVSYLGHRIISLPYIPFDIFDWLARVLPGRLLAFSIDAMVAVIRALSLGPTAATAKLAEQGMALVQFAVGWVIFGAVLGFVGRRRPAPVPLLGVIGGGFLFAATLGIEIARDVRRAASPVTLVWLAVILWGGGALLGRGVAATSPTPDDSPGQNISRRRFLHLVGLGSFTVMVSAAGVSILSKKAKASENTVDQEELLRATGTSGPAASPLAEDLEKRFPAVPGTRPEVTKNQDFYRIDINLQPPKVDGETWRLKVEGLVDRPLTLSLQDIHARPRQTQAITLSCISNPVGGDLISTTFLTGVPFKLILEEAGLKKGVQEIFIESVDGFYESVPLAEAMDGRTLLVYAMNGEPLPTGHGFPLRIYIPGHYGMKQPKWIKRIEAIDHRGPGYWVDRGWSATAMVRTTSVIDVVAGLRMPKAGVIPVGGIAYAGARGISQVEIQVDDGPWEKAELRAPALSPLTWVQWKYLWKSTPGKHTLRVRAYDGTGKVQESQEHGTFPDGATGISKKTADIR